MSDKSLNELKVEDMENLVVSEQKTPGGLKLEIVLSPALKPSPKPVSVPSSPATQKEIEEKLAAASGRREMLDKLRAKNISVQLAKVETAKIKKEELNTEKSQKSKESLETKLENQEKNRQAEMMKNKEKLADQLARVERAQKELEIQTEAARVSAECALKAKLAKAQEKRDEQLEELVNKMKEHEEYVAEVRYSHDKLFQDQENKVGTTLNLKLEKAAKERERKEQELKAKLEERNKKAEMVRQNKEKLQMDLGPESA